MELRIDTEDAVLLDVNGRIEHHGDDNELGSDIKFEMELGADILNQLFASDEDSDEHPHLFDDQVVDVPDVLFDRDGRPRLRRINPIKLTTEFADHILTINSKLQLHDVKVNKFAVKPIGGRRVSLTFRVQGNPDAKQIAQLFEWLQDEVTIDIQPRETKMPGEQNQEQAAAGA